MDDPRLGALGEDERLLYDTVRKAAREAIAPGAGARDLEERFPATELEQLFSLGVPAVPIPEEAGGVGLGRRLHALLLEEIGGACAATAVSLLVHTDLVLTPVAAGGREELAATRERLLAGEELGGFALGAGARLPGPDLPGVTATAADDGYRLEGTAPFVLNGGRARVYTVLAQVSGSPGEVGLFLVPADAPGVTAGGPVPTLGLRALPVTSLDFTDAAVPRTYVLVPPARDPRPLQDILDAARLDWAAVAVGVARAACVRAARYSHERRAFGRPLTAFPGIREKLAWMAAAVAASAALVDTAAGAVDRGRQAGAHAALAQLTATRAAVETAYEAVQIFGGYGYCHEYEVERLQRDAKTLEVGLDDSFRLQARLVEGLVAAATT